MSDGKTLRLSALHQARCQQYSRGLALFVKLLPLSSVTNLPAAQSQRARSPILARARIQPKRIIII